MKTNEGLIRAVGVRGLTAAFIAYVICAVAMALIVMCFAEAGSRVSLSGGTYAYAEVAFGPYVGFMVAMFLWFGSAVLASAAVVNVFVDAIAQFNPSLGNTVTRAIIIIEVYAGLAIVNIRGVKTGNGVVQTVTAAKLLPLLILIGFGFFVMKGVNMTWPGMPSGSDLARTSIVLIFAFTGVESALTPSGEVIQSGAYVMFVVSTLLFFGMRMTRASVPTIPQVVEK